MCSYEYVSSRGKGVYASDEKDRRVNTKPQGVSHVGYGYLVIRKQSRKGIDGPSIRRESIC